MKTNTQQYPAHLLVYPALLSRDQVLSQLIVSDEYVFSTYFAAMVQGIYSESGALDLQLLVRVLDKSIPNVSQALVPMASDEAEDSKLRKVVDSLRQQFNEQITTTYVKDFMIGTAIYRTMLESRRRRPLTETLGLIVSALLEHGFKTQEGMTDSITINLERLQKVMELTPTETRLIELALVFSIDIRSIIFRNFMFSMTKNSSMFDRAYRVMLSNAGPHETIDVEDREVDAALSDASKPIALSLVSFDTKGRVLGQMSSYWTLMLTGFEPDEEKYFSRFITPLTARKKTFSGAIAKVAADRDEQLLERFITEAVESRSSRDGIVNPAQGRNALIYGSRRLDKEGYLANMLERLEVPAVKANTADVKGSGDVPSICYVAQRWMMSNPSTYHDHVLVIDKAEQALTREHSRSSWMIEMFGGGDDDVRKPDELDSDELLLLENPIPTLWVTNNVSAISAENVGRFLFHVAMKGGSRKDRRAEIEAVVKELGFSDDTTQKLSMYLELNIEQVKSAADMVKLLRMELAPAEALKTTEETLLHLVANSQKALDRMKTETLRPSVTQYSLDLLNLATKVSVPKLIEALKKRPQGKICLFGLPGTGKTMLAEHIAMQLDMPLVIKPASEILSKWVGESEKNIAAAFEEAKAEGAILLLDEVDSLLRDRAMAERSWEVSQVNELLMRIERFEGICIVATNLFKNLDTAALRRFDFKLEFRELTVAQRLMMLENESGVKLDSLDPAEKERIETEMTMIRYLTPGDYATIKRGLNALGDTLTVDGWMEALRFEASAKLAAIARSYNVEGGKVDTDQRG